MSLNLPKGISALIVLCVASSGAETRVPRSAEPLTRPPTRGELPPELSRYRVCTLMSYSGQGKARLVFDLELRERKALTNNNCFAYDIDFASLPQNKMDVLVGDHEAYSKLRSPRQLHIVRNAETERTHGADSHTRAWAALCNQILQQLPQTPGADATNRTVVLSFSGMGPNTNSLKLHASYRLKPLSEGGGLLGVSITSDEFGCAVGPSSASIGISASYRGLWVFDQHMTRLVFHTSRFDASPQPAGPNENFLVQTLVAGTGGRETARELRTVACNFRDELQSLRWDDRELQGAYGTECPSWTAFALSLLHQASAGASLLAESKSNPGFVVIVGMFFAADAISAAVQNTVHGFIPALPEYKGALPTLGEYVGASYFHTAQGAKLGELGGEVMEALPPGMIANMNKAVQFTKGPKAILEAIQKPVELFDDSLALIKGSEAYLLSDQIREDHERERRVDEIITRAQSSPRSKSMMDTVQEGFRTPNVVDTVLGSISPPEQWGESFAALSGRQAPQNPHRNWESESDIIRPMSAPARTQGPAQRTLSNDATSLPKPGRTQADQSEQSTPPADRRGLPLPPRKTPVPREILVLPIDIIPPTSFYAGRVARGQILVGYPNSPHFACVTSTAELFTHFDTLMEQAIVRLTREGVDFLNDQAKGLEEQNLQNEAEIREILALDEERRMKDRTYDSQRTLTAVSDMRAISKSSLALAKSDREAAKSLSLATQAYFDYYLQRTGNIADKPFTQ